MQKSRRGGIFVVPLLKIKRRFLFWKINFSQVGYMVMWVFVFAYPHDHISYLLYLQKTGNRSYSYRSASIGLFLEACRAVDAEDEPDPGGNAEAEEDRGERQNKLPIEPEHFAQYECNDKGDGCAEENADHATDRRQSDRFKEELGKDIFLRRAERFSQTDLAGALRDGDEHDIHDADAAHDERDRGDCGEEERENVQDGAHGLHGAGLRFNIEIVFRRVGDIMVVAQSCGDVVHGFAHRAVIVRLNRHAVEIINAEDIGLSGGVWYENSFVKIEERHLPGAREDAHDAEGVVVDADLLADRGIAVKELALHGLADHGDIGNACYVVGSEAFSFRRVHIVEVRELFRRAKDRCLVGVCRPRYRFASKNNRHDDRGVGDIAFVLQRREVAFFEGIRERGEDVGWACGLFAGDDRDRTRADALDLAKNKPLRALAQRHHDDDGGNADHDTEDRTDDRERFVVRPVSAVFASWLIFMKVSFFKFVGRASACQNFAFFVDAAVQNGEDPFGVLGGMRFVRNKDDGMSLLLVQPLDRRHDRLAGLGIEVTGRFVREDHRGERTSARAIATRCFSPPESWYAWWSVRCSRPTS